jgi:hypothetical protein
MQRAGYIIIATVLMLLILSMLVVAFINTSFLRLKLSTNIVAEHKNFYDLEKMAIKISKNINTYKNLNCSLKDASKLSINLLVSKGCIYENYHYIIQDLGSFPCLAIINSDNKAGSHHWLLSVALTDNLTKIIQLRVALPDDEANCSKDNIKIIQSGIITWQYFTLID